MEVFLILAVLLFSCLTLASTTFEATDIVSREHYATGSHAAIRQNGHLSLRPLEDDDIGNEFGLHHTLQNFETETRKADGIAPPRILARRESEGGSWGYTELSDDVLNRYRCYADDLARLREELNLTPDHEPIAGDDGTSPVIGAVFARSPGRS
ncbi:hypothetical protein BPTFM16_02429 [Altererythrobacter insulae]|nr:hypothetical protein BPTFM16_02429 [Altererythrobacter insulae]